jgi:hypothetical protein
METRPTLLTPAPRGDPRPIAPRQLWTQLSADQQRHLLQTLVHVCQELVANATRRPGKEGSDE